MIEEEFCEGHAEEITDEVDPKRLEKARENLDAIIVIIEYEEISGLRKQELEPFFNLGAEIRSEKTRARHYVDSKLLRSERYAMTKKLRTDLENSVAAFKDLIGGENPDKRQL